MNKKLTALIIVAVGIGSAFIDGDITFTIVALGVGWIMFFDDGKKVED
jgi:hypothetical protein